jgi:hypothetical protein
MKVKESAKVLPTSVLPKRWISQRQASLGPSLTLSCRKKRFPNWLFHSLYLDGRWEFGRSGPSLPLVVWCVLTFWLRLCYIFLSNGTLLSSSFLSARP